MEKETFLQKVNRRGWHEVRSRLNGTAYYLTFRSYWHYLLHKSKVNQQNTTSYFAARPNMYAGIGHQMANWIAGLWFARQFGLKFASIPFSTDKWDVFLGFGNGEVQYYDLIIKGYKVRQLPGFREANKVETDLIKGIISTYSGSNTILLAQQDQFYFDQYGVMHELQAKFLSAPARNDDKIEYDKRKFNIAVHVRRTVIIEDKVFEEDEATKARRWLSNDYYEKVLKQVLDNLKTDKPVSIWLFSTGKPEEFAEFSKYGEVHFCSHMDEYRSFAHFIFADLLITSKSSFSYKPALMSNGIKVCPKNFWHGYPDKKDWILCENDGQFEVKKLSILNEGL
jgi:hypothetical protein